MASINQLHLSSNRYNTEDDVLAFDHEDPERAISRQKALDSTRMAIKALNVLKQLLNSSVYFTELPKHSEIVGSLAKLLMSKNSLIAFLSSQVLKAILHF